MKKRFLVFLYLWVLFTKMADYKTQTVPDDAERRKKLNRELNPVDKTTTIMGEATQVINPLTGKEYVFTGKKYGDAELFSELRFFDPLIQPAKLYADILKPAKLYDDILEKPSSTKPQTTDFFEYQLALARKDVRDGDKKMSRFDYQATVKRIRNLVRRMNEANIPLGLISSADGLDAALRGIEYEDYQEEDRLLINYNLYRDTTKPMIIPKEDFNSSIPKTILPKENFEKRNYYPKENFDKYKPKKLLH